jgi:hypothetical protein
VWIVRHAENACHHEAVSELVGPPVAGLTIVEVDGCFHIYNPATKRAVALNETASQIWRLSTGERQFGDVVAALAERYGVDDDAIAGQVRATIDELAAEGLYVETATH